MENDYQSIDSKLLQASKFFQTLDERWLYKSSKTSVSQAANNIIDEQGNRILPNEAFRFLCYVIDELQSYTPNQLKRLSKNGVEYLGNVYCQILPDLKKAALEISRNMDFSTFTLGNIKDIDFLYYSLIIEAYRNILAYEYRN